MIVDTSHDWPEERIADDSQPPYFDNRIGAVELGVGTYSGFRLENAYGQQQKEIYIRHNLAKAAGLNDWREVTI